MQLGLHSGNKVIVHSTPAGRPMFTSMASQSGLEDTAKALLDLQRCLEPWVTILQHEEGEPEGRQSLDSLATARTLVALTLATLCFLKPRVIRTSKLTSNPTLLNNNQSQIQIRSDLNHIRQLLSSLESKVSSSATNKTSLVASSSSERDTTTATNGATITATESKNFSKRKAKVLPLLTPKKSRKKRRINK